jgi:hypothetical protein
MSLLFDQKAMQQKNVCQQQQQQQQLLLLFSLEGDGVWRN